MLDAPDDRPAITRLLERDDDIPDDVRRELLRCAVSNGRISYYYLCDVWRRGKDEGYTSGYGDGLDESAGDPRVAQIEDGFSIQSATNGEYSHEDQIVLRALQAGQEFAVRLARREIASREGRDELFAIVKGVAALSRLIVNADEEWDLITRARKIVEASPSPEAVPSAGKRSE
jgi:hypothetical protein